MQSAAVSPVEEYLSTDYSPDCDFVDGVLPEGRQVFVYTGAGSHTVVAQGSVRTEGPTIEISLSEIFPR